MAVIQIEGSLDFKVFYNYIDCPLRKCCSKREEREKELKKKNPSRRGRCLYNPGMFQCKAYQKFYKQLDAPKTYDLNCL